MPRFGRSSNRFPRTSITNKHFNLLETLERRVLMCLDHQASGLPEPFQEPVWIPYDGPADFTGPATSADIVWTNRGNAGSDSDNFNVTFGANASKARAVVDAVIVAYERMIGAFNYSDGSNTYNLSLSMSGSGLGASASITSTFGPAGSQKAKSGSISMGRGSNNFGSGWFLDPTPDESSEFMGDIVNAYSGDTQAGSPAAGLSDFFTVVAAEMTHCMGLYGNALPGWASRTTNTGAPDTQASPGTLWVFQGASIKHLLTSDNGGFQNWGSAIHSSEPGNSVVFGGVTYIGAQDQGNAFYEPSRRYLINNAFALMFKDAYNYSTVDPAQFGTFYVQRNADTGIVTVRGSGGADTISVSQTGSIISISVDPLADVPGTGALPGNGNLAAFVTSFDASEISSILINAGGGNDTINVNHVSAAVPITVNGESGDDVIAIGGGDLTAHILGSLTIDGGNGGTDILTYDDVNSIGDDAYTVSGITLTKPNMPAFTVSNMEGITLNANNFNNIIHLNSANGPATINAGAGNDTIILGNGSLANLPNQVVVNGGGDSDSVVLDDSAGNNSEFYIIDGLSISVAFFGGLNASAIEGIRLSTQQGNDFIGVTNTAAGIPLTVQANGGIDFINVDATAANAPVIVEASPGGDSVSVNTDNSGTAQVLFSSGVTSLAQLSIGSGGGATITAGGAKVLTVTSLSVNPNGFLDVNGNSFIYNYSGGSPISSMQSLLVSGYAGGAWNGNGIRDTAAHDDLTGKTALGYAEATDLFTSFPASFSNQPIDNTSLLFKHTYYGDGNLDGQVNLTDFNRLAASFGVAARRWSHGDFDFDFDVDLNDFNRLAGAFGLDGLNAEQTDALVAMLMPRPKQTILSPSRSSTMRAG